MSNLQIWNQVAVTDPKFTKDFNRSGGFAGTAINPTYLANRATEVFGPMGIGWGMNILDERYVEGAPIIIDKAVVGREVVHIIRASLWYVWDGKKGEVPQYGQTVFVGKNRNGVFTDEEAPKKSLTDAMSKCLSLLGFSADIHTGQWDDNKYVNEKSNTGSTDAQQAPSAPAKGSPQERSAQSSLPAKLDVPVDLDKETKLSVSWEQRISEVTQKADLENAKRLIDQTFRDPALNKKIKDLIESRLAAIQTA